MASDDGRGPIPGGTFGLRVRTVSEVSRAIRERVRSDDGLRDLWVEGEVGRVTVSSAGHAYFTLKDARAQIQCVWFRDDRVRSPFQPQTGLQVVAHGRMDLFEPQGALQLYVEALQPSGFGNLTLRFEELKARLAEEGLFDAARKRSLPDRPRTIAVDHVADRRRLARRVHGAGPPLAAGARAPGRPARSRATGRRRASWPRSDGWSASGTPRSPRDVRPMPPP